MTATPVAAPRPAPGQSVHLALALLYLFLLPLGTTGKDAAWALLAAWTLLRLPRLWPGLRRLLLDPLLLVLAAWTAWRGVSLAWSPDVAAGLDELRAFRVIVTPLLLWPVLGAAPLLVAALLAGVFCHNLVQLAQAWEWLGLRPGMDQRLGGLLHPIKTAALCAAAMCWHVSAILAPGPRPAARRAASAAGLIAAGLGLVFAGSRGPWLAAAATVPAAVLLTAARRPRCRAPAAVLAAAGLLAAGAAWALAGDYVVRRYEQAVADVRTARGEGDFDTPVGGRLARWSAATDIIARRPLTGTGAGGFSPAARALGRTELAPDDHAHSLYLHEPAVGGLPALAAALAACWLAVRRAWRDPPDHPYADGHLFVLAGWLIGAAFDCYELNGTMFGLFAVVAALTLPDRAATPDAAVTDHQQDA